MALTEKHTSQIKNIASLLNFNYCGISKARFLEEEATHLEAWLHSGMHGSMSYMENHFDKRLDPSLLVPGAKSVVSLLYNYFPETDMAGEGKYKIAKYAYGKDYHHVIKKKLKEFIQHIQDEIGEVHGRVFVDSAPVMERQWARLAGLGWLGKNSLLLNQQAGSFFFLAQLILDLKLEPDVPESDRCGTCTRCIDACPTDAIIGDGVVDAGRCISYFTIELKEGISKKVKGKFEDWIFGCDICQDVCPWNKFSFAHQEPGFKPSEELKSMSASDWQELTEDVFNIRFQDSALMRTGYQGMKRNIEFLKDHSSDP